MKRTKSEFVSKEMRKTHAKDLVAEKKKAPELIEEADSSDQSSLN